MLDRVGRSLLVLVSALLASCSAAPGNPTADDSLTNVTVPPSPAVGEWVWDGLVLGKGDSATACFGEVAASLPPAGCVGWQLRGWSWESMPGATVVGTREGVTVRTANAHLFVRVSGSELALTRSATISTQVPATGLECVDFGTADPRFSSASELTDVVTSESARSAGLFLNSESSMMATITTTSPAVLRLPVLADTPGVRSYLTQTLGGMRISLCPVLKPA